MAVTAKAIARELGLSAAAVSLALRGRPGVSEATRSKVLETAAQMGYEVNERVPKEKTGMLQLVIYKRHGRIFSDTPFFEQLMAGIANQASVLGYHLSISYFYGSQNHQEQLHSIRSLKSDGLILLATEMFRADLELFSEITTPIVLLDNFFPSESYDIVGIDNRYGARNAVQYLIDCGHTRLGYLHSSVEIQNFQRRQDGYLMGCRRLPDRAAKDSARRIVRVGNTPEKAAEDMRTYLSQTTILPTAFFADNDSIAVGCCRAMLECGLRIPQDVSVIGFDDSTISQMAEISLTTMSVQKERMGALAVNRLHERIQLEMPETVHIMVQPRILVRRTVLNLNSPFDGYD